MPYILLAEVAILARTDGAGEGVAHGPESWRGVAELLHSAGVIPLSEGVRVLRVVMSRPRLLVLPAHPPAKKYVDILVVIIIFIRLLAFPCLCAADSKRFRHRRHEAAGAPQLVLRPTKRLAGFVAAGAEGQGFRLGAAERESLNLGGVPVGPSLALRHDVVGQFVVARPNLRRYGGES